MIISRKKSKSQLDRDMKYCEDRALDLTKVFEMADRREAYCKSAAPCPKCKAKQVQLVDSQESHGDWKCRECAHRWQTTLGGAAVTGENHVTKS